MSCYLKVSINDNEDKKIFVVPLAHTLKEDIEREVIIMMIMMMMLVMSMMMMKMMKEVIPSHVILFGRNWFMLYQRIAIMMLMMLMLTNLSHVMTEVQTRKV